MPKRGGKRWQEEKQEEIKRKKRLKRWVIQG